MMDFLNCHLLSFAVELDSLSISEEGEFGHSMFLGKGNQITYLPMPRKYLEAYTTCIVPSYTISIRLYKLIGWTMIYVWSVT